MGIPSRLIVPMLVVGLSWLAVGVGAVWWALVGGPAGVRGVVLLRRPNELSSVVSSMAVCDKLDIGSGGAWVL